MILENIVFSSTGEPVFHEKAEKAAEEWGKVFPEAIVTHVVVGESRESEDYLTLSLKPIEGIPDENYGKIAKAIVAAKMETETCMIVDIESLPENAEFLQNYINSWDGESIMALRKKTKDLGLDDFFVPFMMSTGLLFRQLINPNDLLFSHLLQTWYGIGETESVASPAFSEEELIKRLFRENGKFIKRDIKDFDSTL